MKIEDIPRSEYGERSVFTDNLNLGYTHVAYGVGDWSGDYKPRRVWGFFHSDDDVDKSVATYEFPEYRDEKSVWPGAPGETFEDTYTPSEYDNYMKTYNVQLSPTKRLEDVLDEWKE
jgi:hypothetical protein